MSPPPRMHKLNPTPILFLKIVINSKNDFEINKTFQFVELVESNPLMYNTLPFDQYSRLAIRFNTFQFLVSNSKFEKKLLVCRARRDKSIDV